MRVNKGLVLGAVIALLAIPARAQPPAPPPAPSPTPSPTTMRAVDKEENDKEEDKTTVLGEGKCDGEWYIRVYRGAYRSVVRIDSGGGLGAGFVFHSPRHVATAFHVVSLGRAVEVTFADGTTTDAEVVAIDRENDLAILELEEPAKVPPLTPALEPKVH